MLPPLDHAGDGLARERERERLEQEVVLVPRRCSVGCRADAIRQTSKTACRKDRGLVCREGRSREKLVRVMVGEPIEGGPPVERNRAKAAVVERGDDVAFFVEQHESGLYGTL